ncbi:MAG: hypothetical protein ABSG25_05190, partial [Bryobacteraceae bacterium]
MNRRSCFSRFLHSPIARLTAIALIALAGSAPVFCDEIHDAAKQGDLARVEALLKSNPALVFSRSNYG